MDTIQSSLTSLTFCPHVSLSLVHDKVFQALFTAIQHDKKERLWQSLITYQSYPDPEILLGVDFFAKRIAVSEPGRQLDHAKIRRDLAEAEAELSGSHEDKQKLFQICNGLIEGHVSYVRATAKVLGYELYDKLIDHFYGKVKDEGFEQFLSKNFPVNFVRNWPPYSKIKQSNNNKIRTWRQYHALATPNIEQLKSSIEFKVFLAKLKSALERHEEKQRKPASTAKTNRTARSRTYPQASTPRLALAQRRALMEKRNRLISAERALRNERLKSINLSNIHQLGDQTRICLRDSVIHALSDIQLKYQATLDEDDKKDDIYEENIHEVVSQMHIAKDDGVEEPFSDIIIPEGFVDLGPMVSGSGSGTV